MMRYVVMKEGRRVRMRREGGGYELKENDENRMKKGKNYGMVKEWNGRRGKN